MTDQPTLDLLDEAYRMVRVHGWCAQTYELLERLSAAATAASAGPATDLHAELTRRIETASSIEERILSVALLRDCKVPPAQIAELVFRNLKGKLSNQGFAFFQRYFYNDVSPIPEQITYEITQRVFISFQRAVFQAMRVSEFTSDREPDLIVLYLTLLLCRDSLNEQNRAMVYLLLSRIDATLPRTLDDAVAEAMRTLKGVIRQVEERQESVLSDALAPEPERRAVDWVREPGSADASPPPRPATAPAQAQARGSPDWYAPRSTPDHGTAAHSAPDPEPPVSGPADTGGQPDDRSPWASRGPTSPSAAAAPTAPSPLPRGAAERLRERQRDRDVSPAPSTAEAGADAPRRGAGRTPGEDRGSRARGAGKAAPVSGETPPTGGRLFAIRFSRRTAELAALLETVRAHNDKSRTVLRPAPRRRNQRPAKEGHAGPRRAPKLWMWLALAALLLVVGAVLVVALREPAPAPPTGLAPAPSTVPVAADPPAASQTAPQPVPATVNGPRLRQVNGDTVWYPSAGESLWQLRLYLRSGAATGDLGRLADLGWAGFLARVSELNPGLTIPDLIQPDTPIVVGRAEP